VSSATLQNLIYALIQVTHNFGAVLVIGTAVYSLWLLRPELLPQRQAALIQMLAWSLQIVGGAAFGATSYYFYGHFPDIHGIAIDALIVKVACALTGGLLALFYYLRGPLGWLKHARAVWVASLLLGCTALSAAAFLRWFS